MLFCVYGIKPTLTETGKAPECCQVFGLSTCQRPQVLTALNVFM